MAHLNSEGVELQALFRKFDPFRAKISDIDRFFILGLHLPPGIGRPVVILKFNPFRIIFLDMLGSMNPITTKWLNPSITASETGGIKMHKHGTSQL
ncbi:hypothetical protein SAMN04488519_104160 [Algoriphagus ornithinivorans]|uniref:Uncharacterized protein n=1 Tax=Algoriphagus ornithinivorans TaxID=226506 RepID=A0A1I5F146_9BACT|nr:hypothetical protein [Algoriphagus ornithinivorans]SFO17349.1 hypothetical protein SAMN04488519_104160 [Algoriphagus ornithinivorans]